MKIKYNNNKETNKEELLRELSMIEVGLCVLTRKIEECSRVKPEVWEKNFMNGKEEGFAGLINRMDKVMYACIEDYEDVIEQIFDDEKRRTN